MVQRKHTSLILGSMLTLSLFPALLVSQVGPGFRFMVDTFLVVTLPLGVILPLSLVLCIRQRVLRTWAILGFLFLELLLILFEQWAGHRLLGEMGDKGRVKGQTVLFEFLLFWCFSSVVWLEHSLTKLTGGLGRFMPCRIALTCLG